MISKELIKKISCALGFHNFELWSDPYEIESTKYAIKYQRRRCFDCNIEEERAIYER